MFNQRKDKSKEWMDEWALSRGLKLNYEITSHLPGAFRFT